MKIIELLNKIANGEETPKKFRYDNNIFVYDEKDKDYIYSNGNISFFTDYFTYIYHLEDVLMILNDEVEIIEEEKEIEFEDVKELGNNFTFENTNSELEVRDFEKSIISKKINSLIKNQKKIIDVINDTRDKE